MTTKYQGLPDIDTAPDVFETADEPESLLRPSEAYDDDEVPSKSTSEAIDSKGLPSRRKAERVFGRGTRRPDPSNLVFRPRLPPLSHRKLSTSSSSSESEEPPSRPRESALSRIRRLKAELAEVEADLAGSSSTSTSDPIPSGSQNQDREREGKRKSVLPARKPVDVVSELAGLKKRLERVDLDGPEGASVLSSVAEDGDSGGGGGEWRSRLDRLIFAEQRDHARSTDGDVGMSSTSQAVGEASASLSDLDKRLALLESTLGPIGYGLDQPSSAPLMSTLNKHDHLLALLTQPRHLDAISRRVKLLLVDLDRAASSSASRRPLAAVAGQHEKGSSEVVLTPTEYDSLQSLFNLLPRLDPLLPILPPLLARLRSLSGLHAEASDISEGLRKLQSKDKKGIEEVKEMEEVVRSVQGGLGEAAQGIKKNWEGLEGRLSGLEKRLKDLEG
ncbi:hypothetical protein IAR55_000758 [Kwoniella newhampshirensis]|uniref:Dynactin 2 n=1 Tax=Kwoniella newhampshirensis TaxID=1651941 RepID=A0AAW0Z3T4_9TREE